MVSEQNKAVAARMRELRDIMEMSEEEFAEICGVTVERYRELESGNTEIPISVMFCLGKKFNIDLNTFLSGEDSHHVSYFVTRKDKGIVVDRLADYHFESLAYGFANRLADPFLVTVNPGEIPVIHPTTHPGQEFNYVLEGSVRVMVGDSSVILNEGDSIYFDSSLPHGQQNADNRRIRFLTFILL